MITRCRIENHFVIDATFHQIFKDRVIAQSAFYVLMSNKTENLYDLIFKSIIQIFTQNNLYDLDIQSFTTDTEIALINSVNNNFKKAKRIGFWFHLKQDLVYQAKIYDLLNKNNKNLNTKDTFEIIKVMSILPLEYKGDNEYVKNKLNMLIYNILKHLLTFVIIF